MKAGWVYILKCSDDSYYVGSTSNLELRLAQHKEDTFENYTRRRRPVTLVFTQAFGDIREAIAAERQLKGWRRAKKEALIAGAFDLLPELSRNK